jgi:hypothetical protein
MSRHYFSTHHQGRMVTITLGGACPLQGYFCTVERNDAEGDEDGYVYSILYDDALDSRTGLAESLDYFDALLMARRMTVPRALIAEVERDRALNVGNRHVWYDQNGVVKTPSA